MRLLFDGDWSRWFQVFVLGLLGSTLELPSRTAKLEAQERPIPHNQSKPPNDPFEAQEAATRMTVPPGFTIDVVACEPDLINPVAMTIDERGRFWVCESLEYPRSEPGEGRDRIKILEDTDGDGRIDSTKIFAEGLNIPSGIALGHGGVWVANAPDLLLLRDTDGDDRADEREVVVTGFGRLDTHELPNSLTWGPDGYLYGLNGVFNNSRIEQDGKVFDFTCAMFRIDPRTKKFELFAEGTSNPWGIAWNDEGDAFLSACVIDHLWHLTEGGYYHRQAGAYPSGTWKIESIVEHRHQQAAYCGIHFFDSPAYPEPYRKRLYMGNIHGNCINVDSIERRGATYRGSGEDDFVQANDAWFMCVAQQTGPDGSLYLLDWYDRYHCYQDARRDPEGIDRLKGRLYRVRYGEPLADYRVDLGKWSQEELLAGLGDANGFIRATCRRLLIDRTTEGESLDRALSTLVVDESQSESTRREALWTLMSRRPMSFTLCLRLMLSEDPVVRAFVYRQVGDHPTAELAELLVGKVSQETNDAAKAQLVIAIAKSMRAKTIEAQAGMQALMSLLDKAPDDGLSTRLIWAHLKPLLEQYSTEFVVAAEEAGPWGSDRLGSEVVSRAYPWILQLPQTTAQAARESFESLIGSRADDEVVRELAGRLIERWLAANDEQQAAWRTTAVNAVHLVATQRPELELFARMNVALETGDWKPLMELMSDAQRPVADRIRAARVLSRERADVAADWASRWLVDGFSRESIEMRQAGFAWLGSLSDERLGSALLEAWGKLPEAERPALMEVITARSVWGVALMDAIDREQTPVSALNVNQVRKLLAVADGALETRIAEVWGTLRDERNPQREAVIQQIRGSLTEGWGDPMRGRVVFDRVCGTCHTLHGKGAAVGPDLTANGRGAWDQMLSNVLDPSLVIGAAYQATLVETDDGQVITGLVVEDTATRLVLKTQGDTIVELPVEQIVARTVSPLSLMPENLESSANEQELRDLFALLALDLAAEDPNASYIAGSIESMVGRANDRMGMSRLLSCVLPGFGCDAVGEGDLELLAEANGRRGAIRVHPISETEACRVIGKVAVPQAQEVRWRLPLGRDLRGDWRAEIIVNGEVLVDEVIGEKNAAEGWTSVTLDLSRWSGEEVEIEILCHANNWSWEFGYLGRPSWELVGPPSEENATERE